MHEPLRNRAALMLVTLALFGACERSVKIEQGAAGAADRAPVGLLDLDGKPVDPLEVTSADRASVFVFVRADCPISNRYAPEIKRLDERFSTEKVTFQLVYPDPDETPQSIRTHLEEYAYPCGAFRDPSHVLVEQTGVRVTPEVAVFAGGELLYRGRIDDRFVEFGKAKSEPSVRDLEGVLEQILAGESVEFRSTEAVGCFISDLKP